MKKVILSALTVSLLTLGAQHVQAQAYKTALGLGIDVGDGATLFGPQIKHSFDGTNAGNAQVLFSDNATLIGVDYSYNKPFAGTNGLGWYVGVGPQITIQDHWAEDNHAHFAIRPAAGLEYKIPSAPLAFHFDWKPWWNLSHESDFEPARFSLGFKFTLK